MLSIREDQLDELQNESRRAFLTKLAAHLRARFSKPLADAGEEELAGFARDTAERAEAQGMHSRDQIRRFAEVVLAARDGLAAESEPAELERILDDPGRGPRQKLSALEDWLLFELGR